MSQGTKIGEFKNSEEFNTNIQVPQEGTAKSTATKIGEMSDFEKSLLTEETPSETEKSQEQASKEESPKKESESHRAESNPKSEDPMSAIFAEEIDSMIADYAEGDIIKGVVRSIEKSGVLVDIGYKSDGFIANSEFSNDPNITPSSELKPGDDVSAFIVKIESKEGYTVLSRKRAEYELAWNELTALVKSKAVINIKATSAVQGGLVASFKGIRGFIPASQLQKGMQDDFESQIGQTLSVIVLQADRKRRKIIFSQKQAQSRPSKEKIKELVDSLEVGQTREGKVTSIKNFGVFVDLGGVEGLIHISELSWSRVVDPAKLVNIGDTIKVFVLGVDKDQPRVSLGLKQLEQDPWVNVTQKYQVGQVVKGIITRTAGFGAFIKLDETIEGLIHISELSYDRVENVESVVKPGQEVTVKIIKLLPEEQRVGLSLKGVAETLEASQRQEEDPQENKNETAESSQESAQEIAPTETQNTPQDQTEEKSHQSEPEISQDNTETAEAATAQEQQKEIEVQ